MQCALAEIVRTLAPNGRLGLVIGNNSVCGEPLRTDQFVVQCLSALGLKLELHLVDDIKSRGLMTKRNTTASIISREAVMVFVK
jgi:hypothetical protein